MISWASAAARPRADAAHSILRDHIRTAWLTTLQPLLGENPRGCLATSYRGLRQADFVEYACPAD